MKKFSKWLESKIPSILYHNSPKQNRSSILKNGLLAKYDQTVELNQPGVIGGIYLSNKPTPSNNADTYEVDVSNLSIEDDWTTVPEDETEHWYVVYSDIQPNRIKLIN